MQVLKDRTVSYELSALRSLNTRMQLSLKEKNHYLNLEKGYQGEVMFDHLTDKLKSEIYVIKDLCLECNNSFFQIDTLILSQDKIYPFEIKNFEGDYIYESESFKTVTKYEVQNPLDQLRRILFLLRQLLQNLGFHLPIEGYVVFINPEFTLYNAPFDSRIIFPTQLNRFMKKFEQVPSKLNIGHRQLAEKLVSLHQSKHPLTKLPSYKYSQLNKGIICPDFHSFMRNVGERKAVCVKCGYEESVETAILRSVEEIKLLFPDGKITTNLVHDWCSIFGSKKQIGRILKENFNVRGSGKWTFYE